MQKNKNLIGFILIGTCLLLIFVFIFSSNQEISLSPLFENSRFFIKKEEKRIEPTSMKIYDEMFELQWSNDNPRIARYLELTSIALPSEMDLYEKREMQSDPRLLEAAVKKLKKIDEKEFSKDEEDLKFKALHFIQNSLTWKENPIREQVLESAYGLLYSNPIEAVLDERLRKSLAGDRIELFKMLRKNNPRELAEAMRELKDQRLIKIYYYALKNQS